MRSSPEKHGLIMKRNALLIMFQDFADNGLILIGLIQAGDKLRQTSAFALRPEVLGKALSGLSDNAVGGFQNGRKGAVILLQSDKGGTGEMLGKIQHVAHRSRTKAV